MLIGGDQGNAGGVSVRVVSVVAGPGVSGAPGPMAPRQAAISFRTISAPALKALSLPLATLRGRGAMPQLVLG
ncbi:Uncharacterised protein [Bordetella avium]|nr:Uncharacterised protein [Bordetella avium]